MTDSIQDETHPHSDNGDTQDSAVTESNQNLTDNHSAPDNENQEQKKSDAASEPEAQTHTDTGSEKPDAAPKKISDPAVEKKLRAEAKTALNEARKLYKRAHKKLSKERQDEVTKAITGLENILKQSDYSCQKELASFKKVIDARLGFARKSSMRELVESLLIALAVALVLRTFFVEPYKIPTRSMVPTLLEGDQLFVTKLSYGLRLPFIDRYVAHFSEPERGDVIVFAFPREDAIKYLASTNSKCLQEESLVGEKDYIKRIIGLEGDVVEVKNQVVFVNGEPIAKMPFYQRTAYDYLFLTDRRLETWDKEKHGNHTYQTISHEMPDKQFGPITVAPGHVFVMGDNRDNSADSRCWGQVPKDNIKGRAQIIWWSSGSTGTRWERMFTKIP